MAAESDRSQIKKKFRNGQKPDQNDFDRIIDGYLNLKDDNIHLVNGKMGLGTESPRATLHVFESGHTNDTEAGSVGAAFMVGDGNGDNLSFDQNEIMAKSGVNTAKLYIQTNGGDTLFHNKIADKRVAIKGTGRVGVGTNDPQAHLHIFRTPEASVIDELQRLPLVLIGDQEDGHLWLGHNMIVARKDDQPETLLLNGNGDIAISGSFISASDKKLKENIQPLSEGLSELMQLKPVSFKWKSRTSEKDAIKYGFIAQDVAEVLKEVTYTHPHEESMGIASNELIPVLVNAIQSQQKQIEAMETRLEKLESLIAKK